MTESYSTAATAKEPFPCAPKARIAKCFTQEMTHYTAGEESVLDLGACALARHAASPRPGLICVPQLPCAADSQRRLKRGLEFPRFGGQGLIRRHVLFR